MTGELVQTLQKGNVLIVGIKLDSSGRELLTWTLAKFTNAGDHVIALHVTPSASEADALKSNLESSNQEEEAHFDSMIGVYESFCNIKKVDLKVKVVNGPSLRRAFIEEVKKSAAVRLILGHASSKAQIVKPSFSLAKYCSRRLPMTCSVVVIQHGQVTFEKEGALRNAGDSQGVLCTIQKTLRSHSWKSARQHSIDGRRVSLLSPHSESEMVQDEFGNVTCHWSLPNRFLDSPISVLHSYKYPSLHVQSLKGILGDLPSVLSSPTSTATLQSQDGINISCTDDIMTNQDSVESSHHTLEECLAQSKANQHHDANECVSGNEVSRQSIQENDVENRALHVSSDKPVETIDIEGDGAEDEKRPSVGWPLLRRSIPTIIDKLNQSTRRMSVVEWALQLPDRPKEILNQQARFLDNDVPSFSTPAGNEVMSFEENRAEEVSSTCANDGHLKCRADSAASRLTKLSQKFLCKQFQFVELQAATSNFNSSNIVGKGGCSKVYQGVLSDGHVVAVKCLRASAVECGDEFVSEVGIMCGLDHDHIVKLIGYCVDSQHYMLVYNFASEGNLEQKLHGIKGKAALAWESRCNIAIGVAEALKYLHDGCTQPVIHRDVKSSNILLSSEFKPQLTDFGLAKWVPATCTQITCSDVVGTFGYLAPEYFMFGKVSEKTDVYSFGVVLLELITGRSPVDNTKPKGEENLVIWARPLLDDESGFDQLIDPRLEGVYHAGQLKSTMIAAALCLRQSPQMRPRMSRILKLLKGDVEDLEHIGRQDSVCKESDDGCDMPNYGDIDIRTHLTIALYDLDDDAASQASIDHSVVDLAHSNKYLEEYLGGRYSRSSSFE